MGQFGTIQLTTNDIAPALLQAAEGVTPKDLASMHDNSIPSTSKDAMEDIPYGYCHCGCGARTGIAQKTNSHYGWVKGKPLRFLPYHHNRLQKSVPNQTRALPDGAIAVALSGGTETIVDTEDYPQISGFRWYTSKTRSGDYAVSKRKNKPSVYMHRMIAGVSASDVVDHIDGDGLNNRKSNLRICTNQLNQQNRKLGRDNLSGYKGVSWHIRDKFWRANIRVRGVSKFLGSFNSPEEAARAYDGAARKHFGEYARVNFPCDGEQSASERR